MVDEKGHTYLAHTCDIVAVNVSAAEHREAGFINNLVLIKRKGEPFKGCWALPGGFLNEGETLQECAARELKEETGIVATRLMPCGTYSDPKRDPRGAVISSAFMAIIPTTPDKPFEVKSGDDAAECVLFQLKGMVDKKNYKIRVTLVNSQTKGKIEYDATFSLDPFGISRSDIKYTGTSTAKLAFDHAEIIAHAISQVPALIGAE